MLPTAMDYAIGLLRMALSVVSVSLSLVKAAGQCPAAVHVTQALGAIRLARGLVEFLVCLRLRSDASW